MRILIADTYYDPFVVQHYRANPGLERRPYADQLGSLLSRCFGTADAYSRNLAMLGHEAAEVIVNCEPLQEQWERERSGGVGGGIRDRLRSRGSPQLNRIAATQIEEFEPDVLYVQDLWFFDRTELDAIRESGVTVVGQIASTPPADEVIAGYDLIVTSFPHFVERFEALGVSTLHLNLAFDVAVLDRLSDTGADAAPGSRRSHQASFVGGLNPQGHPARVTLLEQVCDRAGLDAWGYGADLLRSDSPIRARHHGEAWGLDMYRVLTDSLIVINTHIEAAEGFANNMRLFEATGCGALLLTNDAPNLPELFEPGRELVTYSDAEDLVGKVRHYLKHGGEREAIAAAGQRRTLGEHTYERRMAELVELLELVRA